MCFPSMLDVKTKRNCRKVLTWARIEVYSGLSNKPATCIVDAITLLVSSAAVFGGFETSNHEYDQRYGKDDH